MTSDNTYSSLPPGYKPEDCAQYFDPRFPGYIASGHPACKPFDETVKPAMKFLEDEGINFCALGMFGHGSPPVVSVNITCEVPPEKIEQERVTALLREKFYPKDVFPLIEFTEGSVRRAA